MGRPELVLFDLDGVLVHYDRARRMEHLASSLGCDARHVAEALFGSGLESRYDRGELDTTQYLDQLGNALGTRVDRAAWASARGAAMRIETDCLDVLERVARQAEIAILTNNGPLLGEVLPDLLPALFPLFAGRVLCTATLGGSKPAPQVYLRALAQVRHAPHATLFLDDSVANVDGARAAGLRAECVPAPGELTAILADYGLA
jgi:FMN phosphatase YigB (HAD superfamily)